MNNITSNQSRCIKTIVPKGSFLTRYSVATYMKRKMSNTVRVYLLLVEYVTENA